MNIGFGVDRGDELRIQAGISASSLEIAAESIANKHFSDPFIRDNFKREISDFITENMHFFDKTNNNRDRKEVIYNLNEEKNSLLRQSNDLTLGNTKVYVSAKIEELNDKYGYLVDGVCILLGTGQVIAGGAIVAGSFAIANPIGMVIGAHVFLAGIDAVTESAKSLAGDKQSIGFLKNIYMNGAEYLGFTRKEGLVTYHAVNGITSLYGVLRMVLKPDAIRLYRYVPSDFTRKFKTMNKAALTLTAGKALYKGATVYNVSNSNDGQFNY
ncbi:DUF4225 domain-containing protein [Morganella morganii]